MYSEKQGSGLEWHMYNQKMARQLFKDFDFSVATSIRRTTLASECDRRAAGCAGMLCCRAVFPSRHGYHHGADLGSVFDPAADGYVCQPRGVIWRN